MSTVIGVHRTTREFYVDTMYNFTIKTYMTQVILSNNYN